MSVAVENKSQGMSLEEAIRTRRAVKHFDETFKIPDHDQKHLFDLAQQTPSSFNIQHWRLVHVTDMSLRQKIRAAAWDQAQVTDASLLFVLCADIKAWEKSPERYWQDAPKEAQDILIPMIKQFYQGREQVQRDEALRSVGLIAQTLMLSARSLGYDSCPMIGFDADKVAELIKLPNDHVVGMMLAIGKAKKPANNKGGYLSIDDIVIENTF